MLAILTILITGFLAPKWIMDHSPLLSSIRSVKASPAKYADKAEAQPQSSTCSPASRAKPLVRSPDDSIPLAAHC